MAIHTKNQAELSGQSRVVRTSASNGSSGVAGGSTPSPTTAAPFTVAPETPGNVSHVDQTVMVALNRAIGLSFKMPDGRDVVINGSGHQLTGQQMGKLPVGQYGLTMVAASDWEYIAKTYGQMDLFKNGLIFAANSAHDAEGEARNRASLRHGLEPVNPKRTNTKPE